MTRAGFVLMNVALLALSACRHETPAPRHVVLVTIDTLRADRLGAYGYPQPTSPHIDTLAKDATVFEAAIATCPATAPSIASILTGTHRASHRVMSNGLALPAEAVTLAELFKAAGYRTVGRVANLTLGPTAGFGQGFDDFALPAGLALDGPAMLEGEPMVAEVSRLLDDLGSAPFFLWVHLMDPHGPYFPPADVQAKFPAAQYRWPGEDVLRLGTTNFGFDLVPQYQIVEGRTSAADYRARYDAEVRFADQHVGALIAKLQARGLWDDTVFVLSADHGEGLGEHGYFFQHGWLAYQDQVHVPLIVRAPHRLPVARRVPQTVSLVDLAPTLLDLMGLPPQPAMEGTSMVPLLDGGAADRPAFVQTYYGEGVVGLRLGTFAYSYKPARVPNEVRVGSDPPLGDASREELFDLMHDPGETTNLVSSASAEVRSFRARVRDWVKDQERRGHGHGVQRPADKGPAPSVLGDPQLERQLRALGYVD